MKKSHKYLSLIDDDDEKTANSFVSGSGCIPSTIYVVNDPTDISAINYDDGDISLSSCFFWQSSSLSLSVKQEATPSPPKYPVRKQSQCHVGSNETFQQSMTLDSLFPSIQTNRQHDSSKASILSDFPPRFPRRQETSCKQFPDDDTDAATKRFYTHLKDSEDDSSVTDSGWQSELLCSPLPLPQRQATLSTLPKFLQEMNLDSNKSNHEDVEQRECLEGDALQFFSDSWPHYLKGRKSDYGTATITSLANANMSCTHTFVGKILVNDKVHCEISTPSLPCRQKTFSSVDL